jgi:hypothetical protein
MSDNQIAQQCRVFQRAVAATTQPACTEADTRNAMLPVVALISAESSHKHRLVADRLPRAHGHSRRCRGQGSANARCLVSPSSAQTNQCSPYSTQNVSPVSKRLCVLSCTYGTARFSQYHGRYVLLEALGLHAQSCRITRHARRAQ